MSPELLSFAILVLAALLLTAFMVGDRAGWRYPVPRLHLSGRWMNLVYLLLVVGATVQVIVILRNQ